MIYLIRWLNRKLAKRRSRARTTGSDGGRSDRDSAAAAGPVHLVLHQARYDVVSFLRNRQAVFFTLLLPVIFLVIFVEVFGNDTVASDDVKASTYYVPGLSAMAVIAASFVNLVISITAQRETGILKRRRATPVPAWVLITGKTLTAALAAFVTMAVVLLVGSLAYDVTVPSSTIPGIALTAMIGATTFCCLGYAISTAIGAADSAQPVVQVIMLPLYFISGVFIPDVNLPHWLHDLAKVFPVERLADGLHHAFDPAVSGSGIVASDLAVLAAWALGGLVIALTRFTWSPATATG